MYVCIYMYTHIYRERCICVCVWRGGGKAYPNEGKTGGTVGIARPPLHNRSKVLRAGMAAVDAPLELRPASGPRRHRGVPRNLKYTIGEGVGQFKLTRGIYIHTHTYIHIYIYIYTYIYIYVYKIGRAHV